MRSNCSVSCGLEIFGDKWSLILVRDAIMVGSTTFGEFQSSPEKISTNILAARLTKLVEEGIFIKESDPNNKLKIHYRLTEKGKALGPILQSIGDWSSKFIEGTTSIEDAREFIKKLKERK